MKYRISVVLTVMGLLAACAPRYEPAPVTGWTPPATSYAATIRVQRGETVSAIAHRHNVSTRSIIQANHLVAPYRLEVGQTLILPGAPPPATTSYAAAMSAPPAKPQAYPRQMAMAPPPPASAGSRIDSSDVPPSDHVTRPRLADAIPVSSPLVPPPRPSQAKPVTATLTPPPAHDAPPPAQAGAHGFIWPVHGHVVEGYGTASNGTQNDGINIAARAGSPVYASAGGEVVYVGNELRGYGNLVLIKHDGGYITAYAHNSAITVHKGDHVARGQTIARVGVRGQVGEPQLHFEIRMGRNPVDPAQLLPPEQRASLD